MPLLHPQEPKRESGLISPHLFLLRELLLSDIGATQLNIQHALHSTENLLIGGGGTTLKVLHDGDGGVALGGEVLLRHLDALLVAALLDRVCDGVPDRLGLDNFVAAVHFRQVLSFAAAGALGLEKGEWVRMMITAQLGRGRDETYCVASGVLLLRPDHQALALRGIEGALALDDGLAGCGTTGATSLAADLGDGVPVAHCVGC